MMSIYCQVFVEYKLLNVDPADTETPGSVKVTPNTKLNFNFRKTFYIERETEDWRLLKDIVNNSAEKKVNPPSLAPCLPTSVP